MKIKTVTILISWLGRPARAHRRSRFAESLGRDAQATAAFFAALLVVTSVASAVPTTGPSEKSDRVSFRNDVMPVFMRAGCNAGACHGSSRGQDGFHLSLFGYDPEGDHRAITREIATRRINLAQPAESLLLTKTVGDAPHTGGKRFEKDSVYYKTLLRWLEQGAQ